MVILLAVTQKDLDDILVIRKMLQNMRIILIAPDNKDATIAKGHLLRPRFMCHIMSDFTEISDVIKNIEKEFKKEKIVE